MLVVGDVVNNRYKVQKLIKGFAEVKLGQDLQTQQTVIMFGASTHLSSEQLLSVSQAHLHVPAEGETFIGATDVVLDEQRAGLVWLIARQPEGIALRELMLQGVSGRDRLDMLIDLGKAIPNYFLDENLTGVILPEFQYFSTQDLSYTGGVLYPKGWYSDLDQAQTEHGAKTAGATSVIGYLSPEELSNDQVTEATKLYGLGVCLFETMTDRLPFTGTLTDMLRCIIDQAPPEIRLNEHDRELISEEHLNELLMLVLAKKPEDCPNWSYALSLLGQLVKLPVAEKGALVQPTTLPTVGQQSKKTLGGRYELCEVLGSGGFGVVHRAIDTNNFGQDVAIKQLNITTRDQEEIRLRFEDEAKTLANLRHENIVRLLNYGYNEAGYPYLVLEYLDGVNLQDYLSEQPNQRLDAKQAIRLIISVAEALEEAHDKTVIHRDLKPENVFVLVKKHKRKRKTSSRFLSVKLLDFGISKNVEVGHGISRSREFFGTPEYMPPEQARDMAEVDHRSDIYALGLILYECLSGQKCFQGTMYQLIVKHASEPIPTLSMDQVVGCSNQQVLDQLNELIQWMTAKEKADRPQSAHDLIEQLAEIDDSMSADHHTKRMSFKPADEMEPEVSVDESESGGKGTIWLVALCIVGLLGWFASGLLDQGDQTAGVTHITATSTQTSDEPSSSATVDSGSTTKVKEVKTGEQTEVESVPQAGGESVPQAGGEAGPQAGVETEPKAEVVTGPKAEVEITPTAEVKPEPEPVKPVDHKKEIRSLFSSIKYLVSKRKTKRIKAYIYPLKSKAGLYNHQDIIGGIEGSPSSTFYTFTSAALNRVKRLSSRFVPLKQHPEASRIISAMKVHFSSGPSFKRLIKAMRSGKDVYVYKKGMAFVLVYRHKGKFKLVLWQRITQL